MSAYYESARATVFHGDCIEVMSSLPDNSVDSIVTDPPYGLEFMGKEWDAPWTGKPSRQFNEIEAGTLGGFSQLPNHSRVNNVKCGSCAHWKFSSNPCRCSNPNFPNARLNAMVQFQLWSQAWATEALRILKPGGHLLAFGGTRTWHRLAVAIEDAGFEVRDSIAWMYGSGFPKSLDVSKAIDKGDAKDEQQQRRFNFTAWVQSQGVTAKQIDEATNTFMGSHYTTHPTQPAIMTREHLETCRHLFADVPRWVELECDKRSVDSKNFASREVLGSDTKARSTSGKSALPTLTGSTVYETWDITAPATPAAQQWQGWGTALKPAFEPIVVARKPLIGTVAENVQAHGTGALNIDGCRIGTTQTTTTIKDLSQAHGNKFGVGGIEYPKIGEKLNPAGRWPANVILDESQAAELDAQSGVTISTPFKRKDGPATFGGTFGNDKPVDSDAMYNDTGGASRFFYCPKAGKKERPNVDGVAHPTVKPLKLMEYLCRLVTPPGGTILEPFAGSGTTIEAALNEGFNVIGIEMTDEYLPLIMARIERHGEKLC